jgi:hypothetical protein
LSPHYSHSHQFTLPHHIKKWTCARDLKKARQVDYQKIQRKFRKEKKDIEKYANIIKQAEQHLFPLMNEDSGSGPNNVRGTNPSHSKVSQELHSSLNGGAHCLERLHQNETVIHESMCSDFPPSAIERDTGVSRLVTNGTTDPTENNSIDAAESPLESVMESKTVQVTKEGTSSLQ